jgi:hypothetical protein
MYKASEAIKQIHNRIVQIARDHRQHFPSLAAFARPRASRRRKSKAVAGRQGRALGDRSADPVCEKRPDALGCSDRGHRGKHQGIQPPPFQWFELPPRRVKAPTLPVRQRNRTARRRSDRHSAP